MLLEIRLRLHPKNSDTLRLQFRLRNPGVLCIFFEQKISILSGKQIIRELKNYFEIKSPLGMQQKLVLLEQQTSLHCNGVPLFATANCSSNRNVALQARRLGSPCLNIPMFRPGITKF